jgi:hypothetical protein
LGLDTGIEISVSSALSSLVGEDAFVLKNFKSKNKRPRPFTLDERGGVRLLKLLPSLAILRRRPKRNFISTDFAN